MSIFARVTTLFFAVLLSGCAVLQPTQVSRVDALPTSAVVGTDPTLFAATTREAFLAFER